MIGVIFDEQLPDLRSQSTRRWFKLFHHRRFLAHSLVPTFLYANGGLIICPRTGAWCWASQDILRLCVRLGWWERLLQRVANTITGISDVVWVIPVPCMLRIIVPPPVMNVSKEPSLSYSTIFSGNLKFSSSTV